MSCLSESWGRADDHDTRSFALAPIARYDVAYEKPLYWGSLLLSSFHAHAAKETINYACPTNFILA
jgi:hypothetical protein